MGVVSRAIHVGIGHDLVRKDAGFEQGGDVTAVADSTREVVSLGDNL